jgi:glucose-1-phosphate cytidylyltransferase
MAVRRYVEDDEMFLANYSDGLSDLPLNDHIAKLTASDAIASFCAVRTPQSTHAVHCDPDGLVTGFGQMDQTEFWINGGFFVLRREVFDYIEPGDELVEAPFQRMIKEKKLIAQRYQGFWRAMDTFKDKIEFDRAYASGLAPWELWNNCEGGRRNS